jgi:16S rRNA (cytidine1402-2'-O)-methyltransferase
VTGDSLVSGALVVVGTPIGNLDDLSPRAVDTLAGADLICCEDTRRTGRLLQHAGVDRRPPLRTVNDHTEARAIADVVRRVASGQRVALVSDAGMPGISDPGERLVRAVAADGQRVEVVPGPSAAVAALVVSGLPAGRFVFEGFLPRKGSGRSSRLEALAGERRTAVLYEAPHRLARTLADLVDACGPDRRVTVARELTKRHEEVWRGTLAEAVVWAGDREPPGEIVIVLEGAPEPPDPDDPAIEAGLRRALAAGVSPRDAAAEVARSLGVAKRRAYALVTTLDRPPPDR